MAGGFGRIIKRFCTNCNKKTHHAIVQKEGENHHCLVCDLCGASVKKQNPKRRRRFLTNQYKDDTPPILEDEDRAYLNTNESGSHPCCRIHGAMLKYQRSIWRCIECGFAVEWVKAGSFDYWLRWLKDDIDGSRNLCYTNHRDKMAHRIVAEIKKIKDDKHSVSIYNHLELVR